MAIREGDIVSLKMEATYYDGKAMPSWVKSERWIVKSVNGDRVVIDRNVIGTRAICSPVREGFLTVEGHAGTQQAPPVSPKSAVQSDRTAPAPQATSAAAKGQAMSVSGRGVELVAKYEGCRLQAYKCPAGVWTIGYGHTAGVNPGDTLPSQQAATDLLKKDLEKYAGYVNSCMAKGKIGFALNQNQFDALTSFVYNCGNGNLQKLVTGRDAATIAEKMLQYNKGGGKVLAGLARRRQEEHDLFLS